MAEIKPDWQSVLLCEHPGQLSVEHELRLKADLERSVRQHTQAPVLVLSAGATLKLYGAAERGGVLKLPDEVVQHLIKTLSLTASEPPAGR